MHTFQDSSKRAWDITLNITTARKIWDRLKFNLRSYGDLGRLESDESTFLLPQILAVLFEDRAELVWPEAAKQATQTKHEFLVERFESLIDEAETERAAMVALCEEIADFCQRRGDPPAKMNAARTIPARKELREAETAKTVDTPEQMATDIRDSFAVVCLQTLSERQRRTQTLGRTAGTQPGNSAASTSDTSPCDSSTVPLPPTAK